MKSMQVLVFDFDGLILDTEMPQFRAWQEIYVDHGCELTLEAWSECLGAGQHVFDAYAHLEKLAGKPVDREAIRTKRKPRLQELLEAEAPLPGVKAYLEEAEAMGVPVAVASSSDRWWVEGHLERLGLRKYFRVVRTADDVQRTKPDPELYLSAAAGLGVDPRRAIALEDSPNGILAARRAEMFTVAVPNPLTCQLTFGTCDLRLKALSDLSLGDLLKAAGEKQLA